MMNRDGSGQVNGGTWAQETWDTGNPMIRLRAAQYRKAGYRVSVSSLGMQRTDVGLIKCTLISIQPLFPRETVENLPLPSGRDRAWVLSNVAAVRS